MLKIVKWLAIVVVVLIVAVVVIGLVLPGEYHVERSVTIDAPPEVVFKYLNDLEEWEHWEPWTAGDPTVVTQIGEPSAGLGATQSWTSKGGDGSLVFTMSDPEKGITYDLQFEGYDPSTSDMTFEVVDGKTVVTWTMDGEMTTPVIGGYFAAMMDKWVGPMYENGLNNLRDVAEAEAAGETPEDDPETPGDPEDAGE